jgi:hypothetical protein
MKDTNELHDEVYNRYGNRTFPKGATIVSATTAGAATRWLKKSKLKSK